MAPEGFGHGLRQHQQPRLASQRAHGDGRDHADHQATVGQAAHGVELANLTRLAQLHRIRQIGDQALPGLRGRGQHLAVGRQDGRAADAGLLAQAVEPGAGALRRTFQVEDHVVGLVAHLGHQVIECILAERDAAFERRIDADVEPGLDAAHDELQRHGIDDQAGHDPHQREQQHETELESGAELTRPVFAPELAELHADQRAQHHDHRPVEGEQVGVAGGEQFGIGAGRREQEQRDAGERGSGNEQQALHRKPGAPGRKVQRTQSVPMFQSLLPMAVT